MPENPPALTSAVIDVCGGSFASDTQIISCRGELRTLEDLDGFSTLRELLRLDLEVDPPAHVSLLPLEQHRGLVALGLRAPSLVDVGPIARLTRLERLSLAGSTELRDIGPFAALTRLRVLDLAGTAAKELAALSELPLEELNLADTEVVDFEPLSRLRRLRALSLAGSKIVDLTPLRGLGELRELDLGHTSVHDLAPLTGLKRLRRLVLWHTDVADLSPLENVAGLEVLCLAGSAADEATVAKLQRALPALVVRR